MFQLVPFVYGVCFFTYPHAYPLFVTWNYTFQNILYWYKTNWKGRSYPKISISCYFDKPIKLEVCRTLQLFNLFEYIQNLELSDLSLPNIVRDIMRIAFVGRRQVHIFTIVLTQISVSVCWSRKLMSFECDVLVREEGVGWVCVHEGGAIGMAVKSFVSK